MNKYYIGLSTTFHDPAIAILNHNGEILFAEAIERYLQNKRGLNCEPDNIFYLPQIINEYCDPQGEFVVGTNWPTKRPWTEIIHTVRKEHRAEALTLEKHGHFIFQFFLEKYKMTYQLALLRSGHQKRGVNIAQYLRNEYGNRNVSFQHFEHHDTHATMACQSSPFSDATCMIVDSYGGDASIAYYTYKNNRVKQIKKIRGTQSLGFFYMKLTELCGFHWLKGEEWKVMGLAPYGKIDKDISELFEQLLFVDGIKIKGCSTKKINSIMEKLHKRKRAKNASPWDAVNMACTGQDFFCRTMTKLLSNLSKISSSKNLVLAGGCALNSAYNGQITQKTPFEKLYVPSAPGDDGCALGAAMMAYSQKNSPKKYYFTSPYLGSDIPKKSFSNLIKFNKSLNMQLHTGTVHKKTAKLLSEGKLIAWMQGRAEFGPRALGNRSILADPRSPKMKEKINDLVKFREEYRPFAPAILHEYGDEYFENYQESPYMERTLSFKKDVMDKVPAVVHHNGTGRLQTVKEEWNSKFYQLILEFYNITSVPILLNTSLNIMGKPIIHSVEDAIALFYTTGIDALIIDDYLIEK
ncbi:carbamoyltransferase [Candidatus Uabimicrobium sp. HlEnr_7]|uniref:carbamoyltransferase family protein n=1 Tax=Candidatus Uabimicrobium helgolandensis TaxID=3095367 RepID=UPI00355803B4